ncbi:uncharacterized protein BHQ10_008072 [Talaromyces amestolkiae]|uniref:RRM domain-containing protein n=1 Tax=Talaromyces amestolkiae TaxID=1196081 RepID=A0A364L8C0_TALAM|nr:uncharacterized protein BHQ10_008072 [Talaromyces amestolkiae]RAO72060.1 hypothetical protein BHQ10_008072 [Talaromyces amestolkiae]
MSGARHWEQDKEATVYIGNLDERVTDSLVWELMLQAGRIVNVHLPKDRVTQTHQGYGFVEFISEEDAEYAARIMNQVRLYGKPIRVNKASADKQKTVEIGAELFVGNLDPMVTEQVLYDTFSRFGTLLSLPKIARDDANLSKGYGFVSFADFDASDAAIANMHGQYLMNKEVSVQYAYKKDGKGERHGDEAERMLAAQARRHNVQPQTQPLPPQMMGQAPPGMMSGAMTPDAGRSMPPGGPPDFAADLVPQHSHYLHLIRVFQRAHLHLKQDSVVLLRHKASLHLASATLLNSLASRRNLPSDLLPRLGLEVQCPVRKELRHRFRQVFSHRDMLELVEYGL